MSKSICLTKAGSPHGYFEFVLRLGTAENPDLVTKNRLYPYYAREALKKGG